MNRKYKKHGRAIKWIDSRFAWRYRRDVAACAFMRRAMVASTVAAGLSRPKEIRAAQFGSKAEKAMAYASATISVYEGAAEAIKRASELFVARKP